MSKQSKLPANLSSVEVYVARFGSGKADNVFRKVSQTKGWLSHSSSCVSPGKTGILNMPSGCLIWSFLPLICASCLCLHHQYISPRPRACVTSFHPHSRLGWGCLLFLLCIWKKRGSERSSNLSKVTQPRASE